MEIGRLFPVPIGITKLGRPLTDEEDRYLVGQEFKEGEINSKNSYVLDDPVMSKLKLFILKSADDYLEAVYQPTRRIKLRLTQSWTNKLMNNQSHQPHSHANSFISGVFYVRARQEFDRINFINIMYRSLVPETRSSTEFNSPYVDVTVQVGTLLLFPSSLFHCVNPVKHDGPRISLSFNLFPTSSMGSKDTLTYLDFPD
jgi:uncharacterized protein (TIGR02466 family)